MYLLHNEDDVAMLDVDNGNIDVHDFDVVEIRESPLSLRHQKRRHSLKLRSEQDLIRQPLIAISKSYYLIIFFWLPELPSRIVYDQSPPSCFR